MWVSLPFLAGHLPLNERLIMCTPYPSLEAPVVTTSSIKILHIIFCLWLEGAPSMQGLVCL